MPDLKRSPRRRLAWLLAGFAVLLAVAHVLTTLLDYHSSSSLATKLSEQFSLDREGNVPALYSGLLLGCCGFLALLPALPAQPAKSPYIKLRWLLLALIYFYIAFDEVLMIHEQFAEPLRNLLAISADSPFYHAWVLVAMGAALALAAAVVVLKKHHNAESRFQRRLLVLLLILVVGVISLEIIGTQLYFSPLAYQLGPVLAEEIFEIGFISYTLYRLSGLVALQAAAQY